MNIGILIPGFSDGERDWCIPVYLNLVKTLTNTDSVRVFALRYPPRRDRYPVYGAQVFSLGGHSSTAGLGRLALLARTIRQIIRQHRVQRFDVLHAIWADETGFAACLAGRLIGVPVVVSIAGGELAALPGYGLQSGWISRWLVSQAISRADYLTAPSQYVASLIQINRPQLEIVPLGVDTTLFCPPGPDTPRSDRLLVVGSLVPVKGHDLLLNALATLPVVEVDIVGEGPLLAALQTQAESLGLSQRVNFHGEVPHNGLPRFYQSAVLHVLTSRHEAFGMVIVEAAACALPTVGFALGVLPEFSPTAGIAVQQGDIESLTRAIRGLLADPGRRLQMGHAARSLVESHYTLNLMADGMCTAYRKVTSTRSNYRKSAG